MFQHRLLGGQNVSWSPRGLNPGANTPREGEKGPPEMAVSGCRKWQSEFNRKREELCRRRLGYDPKGVLGLESVAAVRPEPLIEYISKGGVERRCAYNCLLEVMIVLSDDGAIMGFLKEVLANVVDRRVLFCDHKSFMVINLVLQHLQSASEDRRSEEHRQLRRKYQAEWIESSVMFSVLKYVGENLCRFPEGNIFVVAIWSGLFTSKQLRHIVRWAEFSKRRHGNYSIHRVEKSPQPC